MVFGLITGLIFAAILVVGIVLACVFAYKHYDTDSRTYGILKFAMIPVVVVGFILLLLIPGSFHTVDAGEIAVVKHLGDISGTRSAGTYFDFWMTDKYETYDAKVQNVDITTQAYSKDAQTMDIAMTVQFQIQPDKIVDIATQYGSLDALGTRIQNVVVERTKAVLSKYSAMDIIETRAAISPEVEQFVKEAIDGSYYVNITTVVLSNIDFSDTFEQTVEDKMVAEQKKLQAEYEKETAIIKAEQELEVAKLAAQARIAQAEGDAEAQLVMAQAEANAIKAKSIEIARALGFTIDETPLLSDDGETQIGVEYTINFDGKTAEEIQVIADYMKYLEYLSKWNGELPDVVTGESATVVLPLQP